MSNNVNDLDKLVLTRLLRLDAKVSGVVTGIVFGLSILVATNWLILKGGTIVGPHLSLLGQFFLGYQVTFAGSLIGFAYAFATGFIIGYLFTTTYNYIVDLRQQKRR